MAAKNAARPRPSKNSDGQQKQLQPSMSHTIHIEPGKPPAPQPAPPTPGLPAPGAVNPMTHPAHPAMQSQLGTANANSTHMSGALPVQNQNPTGNPLGNLVPSPTQDQRQVREQIQFKDMNPAEQSQVAMQQGLDPYAPLKMVQQGVEGAIQQGATAPGAIPNELAGPYVPPGVESFPDDMAHLTQLMQQGMAPGASPQEHDLGLNAHAMANARLNNAIGQAQNGAGAPTPPAPMPPGPSVPMAPPNVTLAPGIPTSLGSQPPAPQGPSPGPQAPPMGMPPQGGAVPPELLAALTMAAKRKQGVR